MVLDAFPEALSLLLSALSLNDNPSRLAMFAPKTPCAAALH